MKDLKQWAGNEKRKSKTRPMTFESVRLIALALPKVEEATSYGTPAFKVAGKLFVRLHQDGESLGVSVVAIVCRLSRSPRR